MGVLGAALGPTGAPSGPFGASEFFGARLLFPSFPDDVRLNHIGDVWAGLGAASGPLEPRGYFWGVLLASRGYFGTVLGGLGSVAMRCEEHPWRFVQPWHRFGVA